MLSSVVLKLSDGHCLVFSRTSRTFPIDRQPPKRSVNPCVKKHALEGRKHSIVFLHGLHEVYSDNMA